MLKLPTTPDLNRLATGAINQLLDGILLDEVYEDLSIYDDLNGHQELQFLALLEEKAQVFGLVLNGDTLRQATRLESFTYNVKEPLTAHIESDKLILVSGKLQMGFDLDKVPEVITTQRIPVEVMGLIALVYFQYMEVKQNA